MFMLCTSNTSVDLRRLAHDVWAAHAVFVDAESIGELDQRQTARGFSFVDRSTCTADFLLPQVQRQHFIPAGG